MVHVLIWADIWLRAMSPLDQKQKYLVHRYAGLQVDILTFLE
jgi:hypothetical protein